MQVVDQSVQVVDQAVKFQLIELIKTEDFEHFLLKIVLLKIWSLVNLVSI